MSKRILVVAVHPDDEVLGAAGALLRHKRDGDELYWLIVTRADTTNSTKEYVELKNEQIDIVKSKMGFSNIFMCDFSATKLSSADEGELIASIRNVVNQIQPSILYVPFGGDAHSDHRIVSRCLKPFYKSFRYPFVRTVLQMEVLSETGVSMTSIRDVFLPNWYVDISDHLLEKLELCKTYSTELGIHPFPRSLDGIRAQALLRGGELGVKYAEAFNCILHRE